MLREPSFVKRRTKIVTSSILSILVGLYAGCFTLVPHSLRLYLASIATCDDLGEVLAEKSNPEFEEIQFWEIPLARLYRGKYWYLGGPTKVNDELSGDSNVFTIFLTAADRTDGNCDTEILELQQRYLDGSRSLDDYDVTGYTALHQAIIFHKAAFVAAYLKGGADRSLPVRSDHERMRDKTAVELAELISNLESSPPNADHIAEMLLNSE